MRRHAAHRRSLMITVTRSTLAAPSASSAAPSTRSTSAHLRLAEEIADACTLDQVALHSRQRSRPIAPRLKSPRLTGSRWCVWPRRQPALRGRRARAAAQRAELHVRHADGVAAGSSARRGRSACWWGRTRSSTLPPGIALAELVRAGARRRRASPRFPPGPWRQHAAAVGARYEARRLHAAARDASGARRRHLAPAITALDISATRIRAGLRAGRRQRYLLPDSVLDYIRARHLYKELDGAEQMKQSPLRRSKTSRGAISWCSTPAS